MFVIADEPSRELAPIRVGVVTVVTTATAQQVVSELCRASIHVEVLASDVLHAPPALPLYIFALDAAIGGLLAARIVAWSSTVAPQPGLIGLVEGGTHHDCEVLLAAGFDDAVVTPASARELASRTRALHRRVHSKVVPDGRLRYGGLTIDPFARVAMIDGKSIVLTAVELAVLRELVEARGRPLSRSELLERAWGVDELEVSERAVDNVILRLRRKLPRPDAIETVRSIGFRIAARA